MLRTDSLVCAAPEERVIACDLAGEAALLNLHTETYYGLDRVGSVVWGLIRQQVSVAQVHRALLERYDVEPDRCHSDLLALLGDMAQAGLITVANPSQPADPAGAKL